MFARFHHHFKNLFVQEQTTKPASSTLAALQHLAQITPLTDYLPYISYDDKTKLYHNQRSLGFVLNLAPLTYADSELSESFNRLIVEHLSNGVHVQCLTWGSPKIAPLLHAWQQARSTTPLFAALSQQRSEHLARGTLHSLTGAMPMVARHLQCFLIISQAKTKDSQQQEKALIQLHELCLNYFKHQGTWATSCAAPQFLSLLSDWLYPSHSIQATIKPWQPQQSLNQQLSHPGGLYQVTKEGLHVTNSNQENWAIRAFSVDEYPSTWALWGMTGLIGDLFNSLQQMPCPFLFSLSWTVQDKKQTARANLKSDRTVQLAQSRIGKWLPLIGETYRDWEYTKQRLAKQDCLANTLFQVILFTPEQQSESAAIQVKNLFQAKGWRLTHEPYLQLPCFLSTLPMLMAEGLHQDFKRWRRFKTLPSESLSQLLPLFGEPSGNSHTGLLLLSRRGQCFFWDNFADSNENYNVCVVAASGAGKSVLINEKIMTNLSAGGRSWVIDVGHSYQKLCQYLKGNYIEFSPDKFPIINPFTHVQDIQESLALLKPLISLMARPKTHTSEEEDSFIESAILKVWADFGPESSIALISKQLSSTKDKRAQNLAHLLRSYTGDGAYAKFFIGRSTIDFDNPLLVLELEALKRKKDLQAVVLWSMMQHMMEVMFLSDRSQKKEIIIDEAWELLKSKNDSASNFIESISRRARKYSGSLITITQGFAEYHDNPAAHAAWQTSATKIVLAQTTEAINEDKKKGQGIHLDAFREQVLKSLKRTEYYSELVIVDNQGFRLGRLVLDPMSLILYSSKGAHVEAVNLLLNQGTPLIAAVNSVARIKKQVGDEALLKTVTQVAEQIKSGQRLETILSGENYANDNT